MDNEFEIFDISDADPSNFEPMGTKSKFWFKDSDGNRKLFKSTMVLDKQGNTVERMGEDWSEKIVCEIAKLLEIPYANYELGVFKDEKGVIADNFVDENDEMVHGNQIIAHILKIAGHKIGTARNSNHHLSRVSVALERIVENKPKGWDSLPGIKTAPDFFCGYVMLDALVSNQDRHDENWGMIISSDGRRFLAPSYDHAASLGRNESDEVREKRLHTKDSGQSVERYVQKAKSQFIDLETKKRLKTMQAFTLYGAFFPVAALAWLDRLRVVPKEAFRGIIDRVPASRMSEISKEFAYRIILANREELLAQSEVIIEISKE